jgi:hypothetical protein
MEEAHLKGKLCRSGGGIRGWHWGGTVSTFAGLPLLAAWLGGQHDPIFAVTHWTDLDHTALRQARRITPPLRERALTDLGNSHYVNIFQDLRIREFRRIVKAEA